jgi:hypothetical protein
MSLVKCADCGRELSNSARACPHCGKSRTHAGAAIFTALVMLALGYWAWAWITG